LLRGTLLWLSERRTLFELVKRNGFSRKFARRFVAGEQLEEAIQVVRELNSKDITASLDLLGESVSDEQEAARARDEVIETLNRIGETGVKANVSVKLTQMGLDLSEDVCAANMRKVLERARELNIFVRLDMEGSPYTEKTLRLFSERLHPEFGDLTGVVIQAYMRRGAADVEKLVETHARVRLCKGAYAEPPDIAFQSRQEVSDSFASLMKRLVSAGNYPGIATHDEELIRRTIEFTKQESISPDRFEFQMLYGVRRDLHEALRNDGFNMRVYVPFGTQWYPYLMRRLAERPANLAFITMSVLKEALPWK
jgi:proline dehydrogenase